MDVILALLKQTHSPVQGAQESGAIISSRGDSDAANPAPLHDLVLRKLCPHFGDEDTVTQTRNMTCPQSHSKPNGTTKDSVFCYLHCLLLQGHIGSDVWTCCLWEPCEAASY